MSQLPALLGYNSAEIDYQEHVYYLGPTGPVETPETLDEDELLRGYGELFCNIWKQHRTT